MGVKVIIAGGRDYHFTKEDKEWLDHIDAEYEITEVVHGGATGADTCGKYWAESRNISTVCFPVSKQDWITIGPGAGPLRNKRMAQYIASGMNGMCILFPGGKGTTNMHNQAVKHGLRIIKRENGNGIFEDN